MTAIVARHDHDDRREQTDRPDRQDPRVVGPDEVVRPAEDVDLDALAAELDAVRARVLDSLGESDARYLRDLLRLQRRLEVGGRVGLLLGIFPPAWIAGTAMLALSKILENMELGHNVMHGQWDWMRDDEVHSTTWEWDNVCPASQWKHTHNHVHHQWTNVAGKDRDIGYGVIRIDRGQPWHPAHLAQPLSFVVLALLFEYGVGLHDFVSERAQPADPENPQHRARFREFLAKAVPQAAKDYVLFPLLSAPFGPAAVLASAAGAATANVIRNVWSFSVIFCGHFPDDVRIFTRDELDGDELTGGDRPESRGAWYRRQIEGSANFTGGRVMDLMTGNLDHQIEHHLFPDLPSNRYAEIAPEVREICERHGLRYNTGSMAHQLGTVVRKVIRFAVPWG